MTEAELFSAVLQQGIQVFVLVTLVYVVNASVARRRPKLAYVLWMLVFVKAVTPPVGASGFSVWNLMSPGTGQPLVVGASGVNRDLQVTAALPGPASAADSAVAAASSTNHLWPDVSAPVLLAGVWGIGVVGLAMLSVRASRRMSRRVAESAIDTNGDVSRLVDELCETMSVCKPECVVVNASIGPALRGFLKPQLLIPQRVIETCTAEELRLILLHELMHIRRRDVPAAYFQTFVQILWWFHPAVWIAGKMTSFERERCCDDAVLDASSSAASVYAQCLLRAAQTTGRQRWAPSVVGLSGMSVLRRRVHHVMDGARQQTPNWAVVCVGVLFAMFILPGAPPVAAVTDETPQDTSSVSSKTKAETSVVAPKLLAMTWVESEGRDPSKGKLPFWRADGTKLTDTEATLLRKDIGSTEIVLWRPDSESRPLVFIFDVGRDLPMHTVIRTSCRFPSGDVIHIGSSLGARKGLQNPERRFSRSANMISFRGGRRKEWPERIDVNLRYAVEEPQIVDLLPVAPPLFARFEIAEGITWSAELVDDPTRTNQDGTTKQVPAGVLRRLFTPSDRPVKYGVHVFTKTTVEPLGTKKSELRTINGQTYQVDTSASFASVEDLAQIEVTRQRFAETVIRNVRLRRDLMPTD